VCYIPVLCVCVYVCVLLSDIYIDRVCYIPVLCCMYVCMCVCVCVCYYVLYR